MAPSQVVKYTVDDGTEVRFEMTIPLPHVPTSCVALDELLIVGLDAGIVALSV